jgi:hypothetical protein
MVVPTTTLSVSNLITIYNLQTLEPNAVHPEEGKSFPNRTVTVHKEEQYQVVCYILVNIHSGEAPQCHESGTESSGCMYVSTPQWHDSGTASSR